MVSVIMQEQNYCKLNPIQKTGFAFICKVWLAYFKFLWRIGWFSLNPQIAAGNKIIAYTNQLDLVLDFLALQAPMLAKYNIIWTMLEFLNHCFRTGNGIHGFEMTCQWILLLNSVLQYFNGKIKTRILGHFRGFFKQKAIRFLKTDLAMQATCPLIVI